MAQTVQRHSGALSLQERDKRYQVLQDELRERNVDAALAVGSNLFYVTNGVPGERLGLFSTQEKAVTVGVVDRFLADIPLSVMLEAQEWVGDVRSGMDAAFLIARIRELHQERGRVGVADRGFPVGVYQQIQRELPDVELVDVSGVFASVRSIKSDAEVGLIQEANRIFDAGIKRMVERVRPGMTGIQAVREGVQGMWEAGGDQESTLGFNCGPVPKQSPVLGRMGIGQPIQPGDMATLTAHAEYHHYPGHSDQEICFGEPAPLYREMFQVVLHARDAVLKQVKAGATQWDLIAAYESACGEGGFSPSEHSQIHQYGIDVPEFPGPAHRVSDPGGLRTHLEGPGNFTLKAGMIYSISPTVVSADGEATLLGGTSLVVTETGYRELTERRVEILVAE